MKLQADLKEFIELLNSHNVDYVVVGGYAVGFHGHPRYTGDIDFLVRASPENARRLASALNDFGFGSVADDPALFSEPGKVVQLGRPPNRIDLLTSVSGVSFDRIWDTRIQASLDGVPLAFIALQPLLENKKASARDKDLADVRKLEKVAAARGDRTTED